MASTNENDQSVNVESLWLWVKEAGSTHTTPHGREQAGVCRSRPAPRCRV